VKPRRIAAFVVLLVVVLAFDQGSKAWARTLPLGVPQPVVAGYWDWEHAQNPGAAFSTFIGGDTARVVLSAVAMIALIAIAFAAWRTRPEQRLQRAAYALIAGGALGNLVDRLRVGTVTDFVRWHVHDHMWPIFNVADAALLIGVGMLFVASWREKRTIGA
jgi:signal peptidase II